MSDHDRVIQAQTAHVRSQQAILNGHRGDVFITHLTWVSDLTQAHFGRLALSMWWVGFGLAFGAGMGVMAIITLLRLLRIAQP